MYRLLQSIKRTTIATLITCFSLSFNPAHAAAALDPAANNNNQRDHRVQYAAAFLKTFTAIAATTYFDKNSNVGRTLNGLNHIAQGLYTAEVYRQTPDAAFFLAPSFFYDISSLIHAIIKEFPKEEKTQTEAPLSSEITKEKIQSNPINQTSIRLANIALPLIDLGINIMNIQKMENPTDLQFSTALSNTCRLLQAYINTEQPDIAKRFLIGLAMNANLALLLNANRKSPDALNKYTLNLLLLVIGASETYSELKLAEKFKLAQETNEKNKEILTELALQNPVTQSNNA